MTATIVPGRHRRPGNLSPRAPGASPSRAGFLQLLLSWSSPLAPRASPLAPWHPSTSHTHPLPVSVCLSLSHTHKRARGRTHTHTHTRPLSVIFHKCKALLNQRSPSKPLTTSRRRAVPNQEAKGTICQRP